MSMSDYIVRPQVLYVPFREIAFENPVLKKGEIVVAYCDKEDMYDQESYDRYFNIATKIGNGYDKFGDLTAISVIDGADGILAYDNYTYFKKFNSSIGEHPFMSCHKNRSTNSNTNIFYDIKDNEYTSIASLDLFSTYGLCLPPTDGFSEIDGLEVGLIIKITAPNGNYCYMESWLPYGFDAFDYESYPILTTGTSVYSPSGTKISSITYVETRELIQLPYWQYYVMHLAISVDSYTNSSFFKAFGDYTNANYGEFIMEQSIRL